MTEDKALQAYRVRKRRTKIEQTLSDPDAKVQVWMTKADRDRLTVLIPQMHTTQSELLHQMVSVIAGLVDPIWSANGNDPDRTRLFMFELFGLLASPPQELRDLFRRLMTKAAIDRIREQERIQRERMTLEKAVKASRKREVENEDDA